MLNTQQKNAIIMAHDLNTILTLMAYKHQETNEVPESDLKLLPTLSQYSTQIVKALIDANTEPEGEKPQKKEKVHHGQVDDSKHRVNDDGSEEWGE